MVPTENRRPDPDALLARMQEQERRAARGRLRIYFGASAGVGKTFAMLNAARALQSGGRDVLVGIVETHGRAETGALLAGLEVLPRKGVAYRDRQLAEFDIDAALARKPALVLVDELAHANAPGSRHPKRWQDVEELRRAGIDVFTTLNVQHLESLNDAVGGITGIRVTETVPDRVFDEADEVVLVDLPADELLLRLKAGKVYQGPQAERAAQHFFRKGNLIALRELALRRTAERIETDVQAYRVEKSIGAIWKTDADVLACIGPGAGAGRVIRSAARLASQLNARWHAVYVETPRLQRLPAARRERILQALKLAQDLGAVTAVLAGGDVAREIVAYARGHNFSRLILGRKRTRWPWQTPLGWRISSLAPEMDMMESGRGAHEGIAASATGAGMPEEPGDPAAAPPPRLRPYLWTAAACALTTLLATPMLGHFELSNIVMLFLLNVVLAGVRFGRGPAVLSAFLSVALFDFFFVPPRYTFAISDLQYLVVFAVMLAVGLIAGQMTAGLRFQAMVASSREARARALYECARELSAALQAEQIVEIMQSFIGKTFRAKSALLLPNADARLQAMAAGPDGGAMPPMHVLDTGIAQWSFDHATPAGIGTDTLPASPFLYLPLVAPMRARGVLAIYPERPRWVWIPEQRQLLDTMALLAAIALERVHYVEVAQEAILKMESERLRNSLLSALSHDLRTPLTALVGLSETLAAPAAPLSMAQRQALAQALHEQALRMSNLVANLLDMARLSSGEIRLNRQWQPIEEAVGSALRASATLLAQHRVQTRLPADLPLVHIDAVLMERVLCNLIENATKYTPAGSTVTIAARADAQDLQVSVSDDGPGIPAGREEAIFDKFTRGQQESAIPGVGLGLAICRAIVEAHGGRIAARRAGEGGAAFVFTIPIGTPPMPPAEDLPAERAASRPGQEHE